MPKGGVIRGTLNISITTLVDDVGLCQVGLGEVLEQIAAKIQHGWRGGALEVSAEGREEPVQRVYWDYEGPDRTSKKLLGMGSHLLH
ncbi:MAG: hypothetical protein EXS68_00185 [Candidatus Ryanbacteria bacterium]|nr:hypothetical protein [Candidatus Ryanbacteria bacterium]